MVGVGHYTMTEAGQYPANISDSGDGSTSPVLANNRVGQGLDTALDVTVIAQASTLRTRVILWQGTLQALQDYPMTGICLGEWNSAKSQYNIE
jgi:hypothetical protein